MDPPPPSYDEVSHYPTLPNVNSGGSGTNMTQMYLQRQNEQQRQQYHQQQHFFRQQQQQQHLQPQAHQYRNVHQGAPHQNMQQSQFPQTQQQIRRPKMGTVPLYENSSERRRMTDLADMFAIIKATESLEAAFSRDVITSQVYTESCDRLITQFRSTESALVNSGIISSAEDFYSTYKMDCPRAYDRLMKSGVSAVKLLGGGHGSGSNSGSQEPDSVVVAETVQAFITAIDALALQNYAIDTVQPLLIELIGSLTRVSSLPPDFEALVKVRLWLQKLNEMRAYEELEEEEARQLKFDLESTYQAFMKHLSSSRPPS